MNAHYFVILAATSFLHGQTGAAAGAEAAWNVEKLTLTPVKEGVRLLRVAVLRVSEGRTTELSDYVALQEIRDSFVRGDRLVVIGEAERASVVEIFDLQRKAKVDWFVCYQPRRISANWIAYKEFYHGSAQGPGVATDVLLVYDLARTPVDNRIETQPGETFPLPQPARSNSAVNVGIPVFPETNARQRSYRIAFESATAGRLVDAGSLILLSSKKLVFRCSEQLPGMGAEGSREYLAVVDLSRGLENPSCQTAYFPAMGRHITHIERIEEETPNAVRLVFPPGEYRVDHLVVPLPEFPR